MISSKNNHSPLLLIIPVLILSIVLEIMHLPAFLQENRPDFPVLILIFISAILRTRACIELAWLTGLTLDLLTGAPLGINALVLCAQVYIIAWQFKKFYTYELWQQALVVGIVALIVHAVGYWLAHLILRTGYSVNIIYPAIIMAILWIICCPIFKMVTLSITGRNINSSNESK